MIRHILACSLACPRHRTVGLGRAACGSAPAPPETITRHRCGRLRPTTPGATRGQKAANWYSDRPPRRRQAARPVAGPRRRRRRLVACLMPRLPAACAPRTITRPGRCRPMSDPPGQPHLPAAPLGQRATVIDQEWMGRQTWNAAPSRPAPPAGPTDGDCAGADSAGPDTVSAAPSPRCPDRRRQPCRAPPAGRTGGLGVRKRAAQW